MDLKKLETISNELDDLAHAIVIVRDMIDEMIAEEEEKEENNYPSCGC